MEIKPATYIERLMKTIKPSLAFDESKDFATWRKQIKDKLVELLGMEEIAKNACPLNFEIESKEQKDGYTQIRFTFESEYGSVCPCYLLIPDTKKEKYPVVITLQGHSTGFHNSIGVVKYPERDEGYARGRGAFAVQCVKQGYIALAIEQRGMGERRPNEYQRHLADMCTYTACVDMFLGRTTLGERVWDVSRAIDVLANFKECDLDKIALTGNSGGGTATFYTACLEERIKIAMPSCAFCDYGESIVNLFHCPCNYMPGGFKYFDMGDLSALIAPRNFVVVAGKDDNIFPITGVEKSYAITERVFKAAGAADKCRKIVTPKGHWWCEDIIWPAMKEEMTKLGWL